MLTDLILEALFTGADEDEVKRRDELAPKILLDDWLEEFLKREDITKLPDGSYDVEGTDDVDMGFLKISKLPIKFNKVHGSFLIQHNKLTTLEGCPKEVGHSFVCDNNRLTSLVWAPAKVGTSFWCYDNKKKFTEAEVRTVCDVKGGIYV